MRQALHHLADRKHADTPLLGEFACRVTRMGGNLARALGTTMVIVGVQWAVVAFTTDPRALGRGPRGTSAVRRKCDRPPVLGHRDRARQQGDAAMTPDQPDQNTHTQPGDTHPQPPPDADQTQPDAMPQLGRVSHWAHTGRPASSMYSDGGHATAGLDVGQMSGNAGSFWVTSTPSPPTPNT
jgi:hypothetical protein